MKKILQNTTFLLLVTLFVCCSSITNDDVNIEKVGTKLENKVQSESRDKRVANAHYKKGLNLMKQNKYHQAILEFKSAIESDSSFVLAHQKYQSLMLKTDQRKKVFDEYDRLRKKKSDTALYQYLYGNLFALDEDLKNARKFYDRAYTLDEDFYWALAGIGKCWVWLALSEKDREKKVRYLKYAEAAFKKTISLKDDYDQFHVMLGKVYMLTGKFKLSKKRFKTALELNPKSYLASYNLGIILFKERDFEMAIKAFKNCISNEKDHLDAHFHLASIYILLDLRKEQSKFEKAIHHLKRVIEIRPKALKSYISYKILGDLHVRMKEFDKAIADYKKFLKKFSRNTDVLNNLGYVYLQKKKLDMALSFLNQSVLNDTKNPLAYKNIGRVYQLKGKLKKAEKFLKKAISLKKDCAQAHYFLGKLYLEKNMKEDALKRLLDYVYYTPNTGSEKKEALKIIKKLDKDLRNEKKIKKKGAKKIGTSTSKSFLNSLWKRLRSKDVEERRKVVKVLTFSNDEVVIPLLIAATKDKDPVTKVYAIRGLSNFKKPGVERDLMNLINDKNKYVRGAVVFSLVKMGTKGALNAVVDRLRDESDYVKGEAARVLRKELSKNFGFDPKKSFKKREEAIKKWKQFIKNIR